VSDIDVAGLIRRVRALVELGCHAEGVARCRRALASEPDAQTRDAFQAARDAGSTNCPPVCLLGVALARLGAVDAAVRQRDGAVVGRSHLCRGRGCCERALLDQAIAQTWAITPVVARR
jgi:hypothetical protein